MVKAGDTIKKDQAVLELETDKATIEVPSSADGRRQGSQDQAGREGQSRPDDFHRDRGRAAPLRQQERRQAAAEAGRRPAAAKRRAAAKTADTAQPKRRRKKPRTEAEAPEPEKRRKADVVEMKPREAGGGSGCRAEAGRAERTLDASIPAAPSARRLARELGVNIQDIQGSGPGGRISMDDVTAHARRLLSGAGAARPAAASASLPDFSKWGAIERKPMSGVRRTTAHRLTQAWNTVPHVFQHDRADITRRRSAAQAVVEESRKPRAERRSRLPRS